MSEAASDRLKRAVNEIMLRWEERAFNEVASSTGMGSLALRDSLPEYLNHLVQSVLASRSIDELSIAKHNEEAIRIANLHGTARALSANYILAEVIYEYHILREVIFDVLDAKEPIPNRERNIILSSLERTVGDAAVRFAAVHADIQQKFTNTLTHDLKTPITSAKLNAELIIKQSEDPDLCVRLAGRIISSMDRLETMIHNLLDASKLRAGYALELKLSDCDIVMLIRAIVDEMAEVHGDRFSFLCTEKITGRCYCDGLRRAVENLVGNAVKYSIPRTPITISLKRIGRNVQVTVHNEGPAIPEQQQAVLFQQYRRIKTSQESEKTGWGLGLTLVKGVVDAHKGTVHVESAEGKGTSFIMEIPLS